MIVPKTLVDTINFLTTSLIENARAKNILRALKVSELSNTKLSSKKKAIAVTMVQRSFCVNIAFEFEDKYEL